jgi:hypothetical protein
MVLTVDNYWGLRKSLRDSERERLECGSSRGKYALLARCLHAGGDERILIQRIQTMLGNSNLCTGRIDSRRSEKECCFVIDGLDG